MSGTPNEKEPGSPTESTQNNQLVKDTETPEKRKREYKDFGHEEEAPTRKHPSLSLLTNSLGLAMSNLQFSSQMRK